MPSSLSQMCACFEVLLACQFLITNQIEKKNFSWKHINPLVNRKDLQDQGPHDLENNIKQFITQHWSPQRDIVTTTKDKCKKGSWLCTILQYKRLKKNFLVASRDT